MAAEADYEPLKNHAKFMAALKRAGPVVLDTMDRLTVEEKSDVDANLATMLSQLPPYVLNMNADEYIAKFGLPEIDPDTIPDIIANCAPPPQADGASGAASKIRDSVMMPPPPAQKPPSAMRTRVRGRPAPTPISIISTPADVHSTSGLTLKPTPNTRRRPRPGEIVISMRGSVLGVLTEDDEGVTSIISSPKAESTRIHNH